MGFPQLNFTGITEGISRTLAGLFSIRFDMPGLPGTQLPGWLIGVVVVVAVLAFQLRKTR
jgi:hypothetical protein